MRSFKMDGETFVVSVPSLYDIYFVKLLGQSYLGDRNTILLDAKRHDKYCKVLLTSGFDAATHLKGEFNRDTGFRPCLRLVRKDQDGAPVAGGFDDMPLKNGTQRRMFSMLIDGQPVQVPGSKYEEPFSWSSLKGKRQREISFTDEYFGERYLLPWVFVNGMAFCTSVVLTDISWNELRRQGYC